MKCEYFQANVTDKQLQNGSKHDACLILIVRHRFGYDFTIWPHIRTVSDWMHSDTTCWYVILRDL